MFKFKSTVGMTRNLYILVMSHEKPNTWDNYFVIENPGKSGRVFK